ncbi:MAG: ATP phosphoribosyltransferase regulatory subunit, partial [Coriobacteriales bacterium]|jgi:histidyl-tRNA synthetase|nr:ATP phosphoribosyltransferase regulatory subunit [Coriobacteriales bacterium]
MGDDQCRPAYREQVRQFIRAHDELCPDCQRRAETNPLRAFDCKNDRCQQIMLAAPRITDALCPSCAEHYSTVKRLVLASKIDFAEDYRLVRGLDYYTRTVFEVQVDLGLGSQNAIGGGGRYDKLIEAYDGLPTPGLGFAIGFERIAMVLDELKIDWASLNVPQVYIAAVDASCRDRAFTTASKLRAQGISVELDHQARSLRSQFKAADKSGAAFTVVLGPDELAQGLATLRNMATSVESQVALADLADAINMGRES